MSETKSSHQTAVKRTQNGSGLNPIPHLSSFRFALRGIYVLVRTQRNARFHFLASIACGLVGLALRIDPVSWALVFLALGIVWVAESLNTALELLADACSPEQHPLIRDAKDVAAGAVLLASVASLGIAACVFLPHLRWILS